MSNGTPNKAKKKSLASRLFRSGSKKKSGGDGDDDVNLSTSNSQQVIAEEAPDEYDGIFEKVSTPSRLQNVSMMRERSAPDDEWEAFGRRSRSNNKDGPQHRQFVGSVGTSTAPSTISTREMKQRQAQQQYDRLIPIPSENNSNRKDSPYQNSSRGTPRKKQFQSQSHANMIPASPSPSTPASLTRVALTRPFGRACLPPFAKHYVVTIDSNRTSIDAQSGRYMYQIRVEIQGERRNNHSSSSLVPSSATGQTDHQCIQCSRSLHDFLWLEWTLRSEFTGAVLIPLLSESGILDYDSPNDFSDDNHSIYRNIQELLESCERVKEQCLENWLADVLNGVRGQGELIIHHPHVLILSSLAMEAFLFRNTNLHTSENDLFSSHQQKVNQNTANNSGSAWRTLLLAKPFQCVNPDAVNTILNEAPFQCGRMNNENDPINSKLGELDAPMNSHDIQMHNPVLESYRILFMHRQYNTKISLRRLRPLLSSESSHGVAWKRVCIAMLNLLNFECDIGKSTVGGSGCEVSNKDSIEESLRIFSRQKQERFLPQLSHLRTLLMSYSADLAQVGPSFDAIMDAIGQVVEKHDPKKITFTPGKPVDWSMIKQLAAQHLQKDTTNHFADIQFEQKLRDNEEVMSDYLKMFVRGTPIRCARTAYKYFRMEASQTVLLSNSAMNLAKSAEAPHAENKIEEDLDELELRLVRELIALGNSDLFEEDELLHPENIDDDDGLYRHELCVKALESISDRIGRWDSNLALEIMEAAGIEDAEVRVEETTRDLRLVRKYAIGLRTCLTRCCDAIDAIMCKNDDELSSELYRSRGAFFKAFLCVLGGAHHYDPKLLTNSSLPSSSHHCYNASPPLQALTSEGVDVIDRAGWLIPQKLSNLSLSVPDKEYVNIHRGQCGPMAQTYISFRHQTESKILNNIRRALSDYELRVEQIESFVYLHCVGIQVEKHYSRARTNAVAAWEKKTDITTAINIATKKKLPLLVEELKGKLDAMPPSISHTAVKQAKEKHLLSKQLKTSLHNLASRRFQLAKEISTSRIIEILNIWMHNEISAAKEELQVLSELLAEIENALTKSDVLADGGAHTFVPGQDSNANTNTGVIH